MAPKKPPMFRSTFPKGVVLLFFTGLTDVAAYSSNNFTQQAELLNNLGALPAEFGRSVSLSANGTYALIGANTMTVRQNTQQGTAYVFTNNGCNTSWTQVAELVASDGAAGDWFGNSVAM